MPALIVQKDPNARKLWRKALLQRGFRVTSTDCMDQARARTDPGRPLDLVLLDLCDDTPGRLNFASATAETRPDCHFILLTGAARQDPETLRRTVPPRSTVLRKPVDIERIAAELDALGARLSQDASRG
ncbi:MAG: hypothetical protein AAGH83_04165 [Pseudomonadota bacterium]